MNNSQFKKRLELAIAICESVGQAILKFRDYNSLLKVKLQPDGQLKSPLDIAAQNWIISLLQSNYPKEKILSEDDYETTKKFICKNSNYWLVDALDGTRSYHDGYKGFCSQIAFISNNSPKFAVVYAPALAVTYWAMAGGGAYLTIKNKTKKLLLKNKSSLNKTYVDSRPSKGVVARVLKQVGANKFLELGSYGLKICKIAEGKADIFLKREEFKIWDTAPGDLILKEAGGKLTLWTGEEIDYSGKKIYFKNLVAAPPFLHKEILSQIKHFHGNY